MFGNDTPDTPKDDELTSAPSTEEAAEEEVMTESSSEEMPTEDEDMVGEGTLLD